MPPLPEVLSHLVIATLKSKLECNTLDRIKSKNVQSFDLAKLELIAAAGSGSNKGSWTSTCPSDDNYSIDISEIAPDISLSEVRSHQVPPFPLIPVALFSLTSLHQGQL